MNQFLIRVSLVLLISASVQFCTANTPIAVTEAVNNVSCYNGNDGSITIFPSGGVAPYTFLWNDGSTAQNRINLAAGNYSVTITDAALAVKTITIAIVPPPPFTIIKAITNETCGGQNIGTINLTVSGGTPGYSFLWSDGAITQNRSGLTAANYYVTVTDSKSCTTVDSANVIQPPGIGISEVITEATCGAPNGAISVTVQYGNPGYSYLWNDGFITQNRTGLAGGNYDLTVTDALGCSASASVVITQTGVPMSINTSSIPPSCFGGANGSINVISVIGSTGPFTYIWNDGPTSQNRTGLSAGNYTVTVTSGTGCTAATTVTVGQPGSMNITLAPVILTCFNAGNGAINTAVTGGVSPYTFLWTNGDVTKNITGLASGNYTVTVTDSKGCTFTANTNVAEPAQVMVTATAIPIACIGGPTGGVTTSVTGGTTPYTYWWGAGITLANRSNINSGNYDVTVTDAHGCTASAGCTIPAYTPLSLLTSQVNVTCFGNNSGSAGVIVSGGLTNYTYHWTNGDSTSNATSLSAGNYQVTVTDNRACTATAGFIINEPSFPITVNSVITDVQCNGESNGAINITPTNGVAPYSYHWNNGSASQNRTNLVAGNYALSVTDNNGCSVSATYSVNQPNLIVVTPVDTNATCFGSKTGGIGLATIGGFAPYTYDWNTGDKTQSISNIPAGTYTVTVTDNHLCTMSVSTAIGQDAALIINVTSGNLSCYNSNDGWINVIMGEGIAPYTYNWGGSSTSANRTSLAAGTYHVTVTDYHGCVITDSATITQPAQMVISSTTTGASCNNGANGTITLNVTGGISPYNFNWGGGITSQNRTNLTSGNYSVTVTDMHSCALTDTITVIQPTTLVVMSIVGNASCNGLSNGTINTIVTGGTVPYSYNWGGGIASQNRVALAAGSYTVTVTDHAGCTAFSTSTIGQPAAFVVTDTVTNVTCNGGNNGSINLVPMGGTLPYSYSWSGGATTKTLNSLTAGSYRVTVTDNKGCTASAASTITQPTALHIAVTATNVTCQGLSNGSIQTVASGSVAPYVFTWNDGTSASARVGLTTGNYQLTVTDSNLCVAAMQVTITEPVAINLNITPTNVTCFGLPTGSISLAPAGGTPGYSYNWGNSITTQNLSGIVAGTYWVTVTDAHSCQDSAAVTITQPSQISTSIVSIQNPACFGSLDGGIGINITGGTGVYSFMWSNGSTNQNLSSVGAGRYTVTVTDANACSSLSSISLNQPTAITVSSVITNVSCFGGGNGAVACVASGGNGGYSYKWNNGITNAGINNLTSGNYTLTVKDIANCSATFSETVQQPSPMSIAETQINASCGSNNGSINITVTGGTPTYKYSWSNGDTIPQVSNLQPGAYSVAITDFNLCTASSGITITQSNGLTIIPSQTDFACSNRPGSIDLTINGGTTPYTYYWAGGISTANRNNLIPGSYQITVTDANACSSSAVITIGQLPQLSVSKNQKDVSCFAGSDGSVNLLVAGGTQPFAYKWNSGATAQNLANLAASSYAVVITDSNGCSASASAAIGQPAQIQINQSVSPVSCFGGNNGAINVLITGGTAGYTYRWSNNSTAQNLSNIPAGIYSVSVTDAANCSAQSGTITITEPAPLQISGRASPSGCNGQNGGKVLLTVTGGTPVYAFIWSNHETTQNITSVAAGIYSTTVSDHNSCTSTANFTVGIVTPIEITATVLNSSCSTAKNGTVDINVNGGTPPFSYSWSNGSTMKNLSNVLDGQYTVSVTDALNCSTQSAYTVLTDYELVVYANAMATVHQGEQTKLSVTASTDHENTYSWTPATYVTCAGCQTTEAFAPLSTLYTVSVIDANGCKAFDTVSVDVTPIQGLFIPNAFTPNHDGNNDEFRMYGDVSDINYLEVLVFDRWGEKVFESNDHQFKWDGTYKGEPAPIGAYIYVVQTVFSDGSRKEFKGSVTLLR